MDNINNNRYYIIIKTLILFVFIYFIFSVCNTLLADTLSNDDLYCNSDLIMDAESGNILFEKNGYKKVYPASTTKVLTAILAIENLDLNTPLVASKKAIYSTPVGSSVIYLQPGEVMSVENLLYGLLIKSGNEVANVLAEAVSGDMDKFVDLMNDKLKEIGCKNSHFTNAHGFHEDNHYTTAYDMAILMRYAMQNETFRKIIETKEYTIPATNKSEAREYKNTNKMFDKKYSKMYYEYVLGGKTGYTEEARGTFIGYGKKDDKLVIVSAFDGSQNINRQEGRFLDSITLFDYAFDNFYKYKILDKSNFTFKIKDDNINTEYTVSIDADKYALSNSNKYNLKYNININPSDLSNININEKVGTITITSKGQSLNINNTYDIILIEKNTYFTINSLYKYITHIVILILVIILIKNIREIVKRNKKRKNTYNAKNYKRIRSIR